MKFIFPSVYQELIYKRSYARWLDDEKRRENWDESVNRYRDYMIKRVVPSKQHEFKKACEAKRRMEVMGSMRAFWTAGPALDRCNSAGYNCAYTVIDKPRAFAEVLYILMNGC